MFAPTATATTTTVQSIAENDNPSGSRGGAIAGGVSRVAGAWVLPLPATPPPTCPLEAPAAQPIATAPAKSQPAPLRPRKLLMP